jgi:hypothetical protein
MNYVIASEIHACFEATAGELRFDLYRAAARYAALRAKWHLASPMSGTNWMCDAWPPTMGLSMH